MRYLQRYLLLTECEQHLALALPALQASVRGTVNADGALLCACEDVSNSLDRIRRALAADPTRFGKELPVTHPQHVP